MAVLTITTSTGDASDVAAAVGDILGLRDGAGQQRSATLAEVKQFTIDYWRRITKDYKRKLRDAALVEPADINPT